MNFITGATGMLGAHLIGELLKRAMPVVAGCRSIESTEESLALLRFMGFSEEQIQSIQWRICDVLDTDALIRAFDGCSTVYHTAAIVSYHSKDRAIMYETNVQGTANVVNVALSLGGIKIIHVSSIASLGKSNLGQTLNENTEWKNSAFNTHYGITKHLSDLEIWRGVQEGIEALIVHPGFIIGAGSFERSSPSVFKKIKEGLAYYPPGGTGFISAKDCAFAMVELAHSKARNEAFVLVTRSESMEWLFQHVAAALGCPAPNKLASPMLMQIARIAEWLKELLSGKKALITRETVKNASIQFYYDNQKLMSAIPNRTWDLEPEILFAAKYFDSRRPSRVL
jgi:nucleoside-diphosphate-sugar epimerase